MAVPGVFLVLEGSDGSGKGTQFNLLKERLKAVGYDVATYDFPQYEEDSSHFVKEYLNGNYGPAGEISPYTASLFYALDRYAASKKIRADIDAGKIVLANRYVGSNMAHQGSKFGDPGEQRGFFVWEDNLEYEMLKLPRPDINIFLRVPAEVSYELIAKKNARSYTAAKRDEHEADIEFLRKSVATYDLLCQLFPRDFKAIDCVKDGDLMSVPQISDLIWNKIKPLLPPEKPRPAHSAVVTLGAAEPAAQGPLIKESPEKLVMPFKSASLLLRQQIESVFPGSTTSKVTDWAAAGFEYYSPQNLSRNVKQGYKDSLDKIVEGRRRMVKGLESYYQNRQKTIDSANASQLLAPLTPLSAVVPFEVSLDKEKVLPLARRLLEADSAESQWAAKQIYLMARQTWPNDFKEPLETSDILLPLSGIIAKLGPERLAPLDDQEFVKLLEATPRQEFDLIAESVYPFSNLSLSEITDEVADWPYQQKFESLRQAASQPSLLRKVTYKIDVISDQISMNELVSAAGLQFVQAQARTPRYGFEVPRLFEDANLDDLYNDIFDESLRLYSLLQAGGAEDSAAYATLLGHRVRWQLSASAENLIRAYHKRPIPYKNLMNRLLETIAEVHPVLWDVLTAGPADNPAASSTNKIKPYHQRRRKTGRSSKPKKS